jgi:TetR/AcrR family transcriptional regulator
VVTRAAAVRKAGRPRKTGNGGSSPRDEIIVAATRLFAERGYANTTMTDIARAAGLQQPSLYYWFPRKEQILQAAFALNRAPLQFMSRVATERGTPALMLYRLLRYDTRQLCLASTDFNEIESLAEQQRDEFGEFWRDYEQLYRWVVVLLEAGMERGEFVELDPAVVAMSALCLDEGLQKRYRSQLRHDSASSSSFVHPQLSADEYAELSAATTLRAVLKRPTRLARLVELAATHDDS